MWHMFYNNIIYGKIHMSGDEMKTDNKAFTLIEVLAVIVMLGIIYSIGNIAISAIIESSHENSCKRTREGMLDAIRLNQYAYDISDREAYNNIIESNSIYIEGKAVCIDGGEYTAIYDGNNNIIDIYCSEHGFLEAESELASVNTTRYNPTNEFMLDDYLKTDDFLGTIRDGNFMMINGSIFFETNSSTDYLIQADLKLDSNNNGFGIFMETGIFEENGELDLSKDSGYLLKFVTTNNDVNLVLNRRVDGEIQADNNLAYNINEFTNTSSNNFINNDHIITVNVVSKFDNSKEIFVKVDGISISNGAAYTYKINDTNQIGNYIGLNTWNVNNSVEFTNFLFINK